VSEPPIVDNDLPFLTRAERGKFKRAREQGKVSFFKLATCAQCGQEIPKTDNKRYCSHECYIRAGGTDAAEQQEDDEDGDWPMDR
jgi:hypothetical protein